MSTQGANAGASKGRLLLLGCDGVINHRMANGYLSRWQDFTFLPGVLEALRLLRENGYTVLVVSNQSCVGRGIQSRHELQYITRRMRLEVALAGGAITKVYHCTHAPGERCGCRVPQPGLLMEAMQEHQAHPAQVCAIGSSTSEVEAAMRAGCQSLLIHRGAFLERPKGGHFPQVVSNLREAAEILLRRGTPSLEEMLRREWPRWQSPGQPGLTFSHWTTRIMA